MGFSFLPDQPGFFHDSLVLDKSVTLVQSEVGQKSSENVEFSSWLSDRELSEVDFKKWINDRKSIWLESFRRRSIKYIFALNMSNAERLPDPYFFFGPLDPEPDPYFLDHRIYLL